VVRSGPELDEILELLANGERAEVSMRIEAALLETPAYSETAAGHTGGEGLDRAVDSTIRALHAIRDARRWVREGRLDDLTASARAAAAAVPDALPGLAMFAGSLLQAAFRFTGDPALRDEALDELRRVADRVDHPETAIQARALMGSVHLLAGSFHATHALCDAALDLARVSGLEDRPAAAMAHQFRGYVLFEWNRLDQARESLERAWDVSTGGRPGVRSGVARMAALVAAARGDRIEADEWLRRLETVLSGPITLRNHQWLTTVLVRHSLGTGDPRAIDDWLHTWDRSPAALAEADDRLLTSRLHELDTALALLEAAGRRDSVPELAALIRRGARDRRIWFDVRALTAAAVAHEAAGRHDEADDLWREALDAGASGSFVRAFIDGDPLRMQILTRLADAEPTNIEARRVIAAATEHHETGPDREPLTARQLDVLRLVERGCSNKMIARELGISLSTVKTHLRTAFDRLDAGSRTQAIARARDRGLI